MLFGRTIVTVQHTRLIKGVLLFYHLSEVIFWLHLKVSNANRSIRLIVGWELIIDDDPLF